MCWISSVLNILKNNLDGKDKNYCNITGNYAIKESKCELSASIIQAVILGIDGHKKNENKTRNLSKYSLGKN